MVTDLDKAEAFEVQKRIFETECVRLKAVDDKVAAVDKAKREKIEKMKEEAECVQEAQDKKRKTGGGGTSRQSQ